MESQATVWHNRTFTAIIARLNCTHVKRLEIEVHHLEYHDKELGSVLIRHWIKKNILILLASSRFRIHNRLFKTFHSGKRIQKVGGILMPDSPDTCGRKPNLERKSCGLKISGYVWTGPLPCITLFCTFLLPSLHDYDMKPKFKSCGGREHKITTFRLCS